MNWRWVSLALLTLPLGGCYFAQLPDPNEIQGVSSIDPAVMQRNIGVAYQTLGARVAKGQITEAEKMARIQEMAQGIVSYVDPATVADAEAWRFADLYRQAGDLKTSRELYERAVTVAVDEDRRVNDTLQLARVMAEQGDVKFAVETARKTFDTPATEKAPILMAVLYEIIPAAIGTDDNVVLAQLLEDAIGQQLLVQVDSETEAGKAFLVASEVHREKAWDQVFRLYSKAGRDDLLKRAISRKSELDEKVGRV